MIALAATTPDSMILTHARWLCGIYTRNDPREVADLQAAHGDPGRADLPARGASAPAPGRGQAAAAEEDREMEEWGGRPATHVRHEAASPPAHQDRRRSSG